MREIKFRGKRIDNGEWLYGNIQIPKPAFNKYFMWGENNWQYEVLKESVGQFTGLFDKNGKEMFEGDILQTKTDKPIVVSWSERFASFVLNRKGWAFAHYFGEGADPNHVEIIGNVFDNPELLK